VPAILERGYSHYFYGSAAGVPEQLADRLQARFPGLRVAGVCSPPFRPLSPAESVDIAGQINQAAPDIVWVGLGTPKQDLWMASFGRGWPRRYWLAWAPPLTFTPVLSPGTPVDAGQRPGVAVPAEPGAGPVMVSLPGLQSLVLLLLCGQPRFKNIYPARRRCRSRFH